MKPGQRQASGGCTVNNIDTPPLGVTRLSQGMLLDEADQDTCL